MPARPRIRPPVGKSGPCTIWHSSSIVISGLSRCGDAGVDHLAQVVRRNVGGHADGDAARAVDQQVRELRRQHRPAPAACRRSSRGNRPCPCRDRRAACRPPWPAGIPCSAPPPADRRRPSRSCPGRRPAAGAWRNPAPCAPAHRRSAQVAVRMIFAHHLADDAGRLDVLLVPVEPQLVHPEQDAAVHGLQPVAHVGQRARDDHAHGVIEIAALHLLGDGDRPDVARAAIRWRTAARSLVVVGQVGTAIRLLTLCARMSATAPAPRSNASGPLDMDGVQSHPPVAQFCLSANPGSTLRDVRSKSGCAQFYTSKQALAGAF